MQCSIFVIIIILTSVRRFFTPFKVQPVLFLRNQAVRHLATESLDIFHGEHTLELLEHFVVVDHLPHQSFLLLNQRQCVCYAVLTFPITQLDFRGHIKLVCII
jgi:hypothetical protein